MGFFSWNTADTNESISNIHSDRGARPVYLLQPDGKPAILEDAYNGYGVFGGKDAHIWLMETNAEVLGVSLNSLTTEQIRGMGISLDCGTFCVDTETGENWIIYHADGRALIRANYFAGMYSDMIPQFGSTANELIQSGRFVKRNIRDVCTITYPLKFSFDPEAVYEDLPASTSCDSQGFFYEK